MRGALQHIGSGSGFAASLRWRMDHGFSLMHGASRISRTKVRTRKWSIVRSNLIWNTLCLLRHSLLQFARWSLIPSSKMSRKRRSLWMNTLMCYSSHLTRTNYTSCQAMSLCMNLLTAQYVRLKTSSTFWLFTRSRSHIYSVSCWTLLKKYLSCHSRRDPLVLALWDSSTAACCTECLGNV